MKFYALCSSNWMLEAMNSLHLQGDLVKVGIPATTQDPPLEVAGWCESKGIPVTRFAQNTFADEVESWLADADCLLVMAFPWKIPGVALEKPQLGAYNFHFAKVPEYRGPEPMFWTLRNREAEGAVTIFKMDEGWDTGPVLLTRTFQIQNGLQYGAYMAICAKESAQMIADLLEQLSQETPQLTPQDESAAKYYPRPGIEDVKVSFTQMSAEEIHAVVAACNPWNKGAYAFVAGLTLRILETAPAGLAPEGLQPGSIAAADMQHGLFVVTQDLQVVQLRIVYNDLGYLTGARLVSMGIHGGMTFE